MALVEIKNLQVRFSSTATIDNLNLVINEQDFVTLIGASGKGKSTILKLLSGNLPSSQGDIHWKTQPEISLVPQEPSLLPWRTALENVFLPLQLGKRKNSKTSMIDQANQLLKLVGLQEYSRYFPAELSGGMQMRVALARALMVRPNLLLLDEPFSSLDELNRFRLAEELLRLWQKEQWSAVFVTHSVSEAVFLSKRVCLLSGTPAKIVQEFEVPFPYPRSHNLRMNSEFLKLTAEIGQALWEK